MIQTYIIRYANDETRSAGDCGYSRLCDAKRVFNCMKRTHPNAEMWLDSHERGRMDMTLFHYVPGEG